MARKNPFANLVDSSEEESEAAVMNYAVQGASRAFKNSLDEMASRADSLLDGESIVELDPTIIDGSFVRDRLESDEDDFRELVEAIRERGQDTPILVRPHPKVVGRYMVVFGHRRLKAAKLLGRKVRAVVKDIEDNEHVVAQGQENSARANLTFIERARFAASLVRLNFDNDNATVLAALTIDRTTLSKMLSVAALATEILDGIGPAKNVGRDRWYELKLLLDNPALLKAALDFMQRPDLRERSSDDRFNEVLVHVKAARTGRRPKVGQLKRNWTPGDGSLSAEIISNGKRFNLALTAQGTEAKAFGEYLSENLDRFYEAFRQVSKTVNNGD